MMHTAPAVPSESATCPHLVRRVCVSMLWFEICALNLLLMVRELGFEVADSGPGVCGYRFVFWASGLWV